MSERSATVHVRKVWHSYLLVGGLGAVVTAVVVASTLLEKPSDAGQRAGLYAVLGIVATIVVAVSSEKIQGEIREFLMERVRSRRARTAAVIDLCEKADHEFCAVTYFPVVGIRDDPHTAPRRYLNALEEKLDEKVKVTLVSVSCAEAKEYSEDRGFTPESIDALIWVERRLEELVARYPNLRIITVPGSAITVNVCHNEEAALVYHMSPDNDNGLGFKSADPLVVDVAKGGALRYATYSLRNGSSGD